MNDQVKEKVDKLKVLLDSITPEELKQIVSNTRPKRIDKEDFKVIYKTINDQIKNHLKGKIAYSNNKHPYIKKK